jgi:histidinol-phosphate phosphatase family protein
MFAVILAGGKGTRLAERSHGLPKPLVAVNGRPLLEYQLELLARHGVEGVTVLCGYGADAIRSFCGDGARWGLRLRCVDEARPLGTAGAVISSLQELPEKFLVLYGDTMVNVDLARFYAAHEEACAAATLFVHPNDHPNDSDLVETDRAGNIIAFHPYPHPPDAYLPNQVNAALYVLNAKALQGIDITDGPLDFGKHVFPEMLRRGERLHVYRSPEYIKDAGTPERLDKVSEHVRMGVVQRSSLEIPRPAIFLDRDGTLNEEVSYISSPEKLKLIPGATEAIKLLRAQEYRIVVVTNQPVLARGECSFEQLAHIHNHMEMQLGREGAYVDGIYFCPHHPDRGFEGEVPELKIQCACRKPGIALIEEAARDLNLDLSRSWLIGDMTADLETARRAGVKSILVETGYAGKDGKFAVTPQHVSSNLLEAAKFLVAEGPTH